MHGIPVPGDRAPLGHQHAGARGARRIGQRRIALYGSQIRSRRDAVLVNDTTKSIASLDLTATPFRHR
jgi:hypothetical protein